MAKLKTYAYDSADYLDSPETIDFYLDEAFKTGDAAFIAHAIGTVARAKGMAKVARKSKLSRESLCKALSAEGNPEFATIIKVMNALDLKMTVVG